MSATTIGEPPPTSDQVGAEQVVVDLLQAAKLTTDEIGLLNTIANLPLRKGAARRLATFILVKISIKPAPRCFN